ncbi:MAG TPA: lytic transglycosylase domain-containing protein [Bacteriovoracaceae bacterium]|nr:lytic transglycosylase domain-containing protein [Bacteriovoracaceae bacterium]
MSLKVTFILLTCLLFESLSKDFLIAKATTALNPKTHQIFINTKITSTLKKRLPKIYRSSAGQISKTIISEAARYGLDPLIITAVIASESNFNPKAIGPVGEIGLMQLRTSTAKWISRKMKIPWKGEQSLRNPNVNIRIGTAYLSYLRQQFVGKSGYLYLAAYNMGIGSVNRVLARKVEPKIYSHKVMKNYLALND